MRLLLLLCILATFTATAQTKQPYGYDLNSFRGGISIGKGVWPQYPATDAWLEVSDSTQRSFIKLLRDGRIRLNYYKNTAGDSVLSLDGSGNLRNTALGYALGITSNQISIDTTLLSTRGWRDKLKDSLTAISTLQWVTDKGNLVTATLGSNMVSSWTNNVSYPFETLTTSGADITSAINAEGDFGFAYSTISVQKDSVYRVSFSLTLNSGLVPYISVNARDNITTGATVIKLAQVGSNTFEWTSDTSATVYVSFYLNPYDSRASSISNFSVSGFSIKKVTGSIDIPALYADNIFSRTISSSPDGYNEVFGLYGKVNYNKRGNTLLGKWTRSDGDSAVVIGDSAYATDTWFTGATAWGGRPVIIGTGARGNGTSLGYKTYTDNAEAVAIGPQSEAVGYATIAIGDHAKARPTGGTGNATVIGDVVWTTGRYVYLNGGGIGTAYSHIAAFAAQGSDFTFTKEMATADHQGFLGWYDDSSTLYNAGQGFINDWYLGPILAQAPHAISLNMTSLRGTNKAGVDFTLNLSKATGNAVSGGFGINTSDVGASGSTLQTATQKFYLSGKGNLVLGTGNPLNIGVLPNAKFLTLKNSLDRNIIEFHRISDAIPMGDVIGQYDFWAGSSTPRQVAAIGALAANSSEDAGYIAIYTRASAAGGITQRWKFTENGDIVPSADNTYKVGALTARPLSTYTHGLVVAGSTVAANYTTSDGNHTLLCSAGSGNITITLHSTTGQILVIKKIDATANTVTINPSGGGTIDGAASKVLSTQYAGYVLYSVTPNEWVIIGTF